MCQTFFYIPAKVFGLPLLGFDGLLFWAFLIFAGVWLVWSFLKRGFNSDDVSFAAVIVLVALLAGFFLPKIADPEKGLPIRGYGAMLVLAFTSASALLVYRGCKKRRVPKDMMFSLILWCVVSGLLGARLFHIIEYLPSYTNSSNPIGQMLLFTEGGLVVYGGIIGGMIATMVFFYRNRLSVLAMFDVMAPALLLGIAIGRLGCLMNGCCYGAVCDISFCITFPPQAPAYAAQAEENKTFLGGLKFVPYETEKRSNAIDVSPLTHQHNSGGCSCNAFSKREISQAEQKRLDALPAMIAEVKPGSAAEQAGLKQGMIVQNFAFYEHGQGDAKTYLSPDGILNARMLKESLYRVSLDHADADIAMTIVQPEGEAPAQTFRFAMSAPEVLPVYPTQLMSFFGAVCLSLLIMMLERFNRRDGFACMLFLFLYSTGRFCIEMFRDDEASYMGTGLSIAQNVSIVIFVLGIVVAIYIFSRPPRQALESRFPIKTENTTNPDTTKESNQKPSKKREKKETNSR